MKKIAFTLFSLILSLGAFSQWAPQNSGTTHDFTSSSFVDASTGYVLGFNGSEAILLKTTDSGDNWTPTNFYTTNYCTNVFFLDAMHGWVADNKGLLHFTTDGGENWDSKIITNKYLHAVQFTDINTGWVVGENGQIFKTTNGGTTWDQQTSGTVQRLVKLFFLDSQNGWTGGWGGVLLHTTNGGDNWTDQTDGTTYDITGISFLDANNGWISGTNFNGADAVVRHTIDGGSTWETQFNPLNYLNELTFVSLTNGYVTGWSGEIYFTENGGIDWTIQASGVSTTLYTVSFVDEDNGWCAGSGGVIVHTTNGGIPVGIGEVKKDNGLGLSCTPNPASGMVTIGYALKDGGNARITITNATGSIVCMMDQDSRSAGAQTIRWDAGSVLPGMYFCKLESAGKTEIIKVLVQ
jgi:photosystem II stability/assembly factor-like uncharacterized protein